MGISRDSRHKRSATGAKRAQFRKKRKFELGRQPANTKIVRTNTLTKAAIVQIDATPFKQWFEGHYGQTLGKKVAKDEVVAPSKNAEKKWASRAASAKIETAVSSQFSAGRLYAAISSRPGQSGRCDGYILEGEELAFYLRRLTAKK
ncbi:ribosomal protein S8A [Monosporozyma unispora]|nr:ribosomal protein S8A [Kazachstania unispora]